MLSLQTCSTVTAVGTVGKVNPVEEFLLCKFNGLDVVILERAQVTVVTSALFLFTRARADVSISRLLKAKRHQ